MIAIPVKADPSNPLNSRASKLFGKAPAFVLISQEGTSSILANDFANGKQLAQALINSGVKTLITTHLREKPYQMLTAAAVQIKYDDLSDTAAAALAASPSSARAMPPMPTPACMALCPICVPCCMNTVMGFWPEHRPTTMSLS